MPTDTSFGEVRQFEDFLCTAIADLPEIDILNASGQTCEVIADADGRIRMTLSTANDDDVAAVSFGATNYVAGEGYLKMEARIILSAITDNKYFVGFGDSLASADETTFSATSDVISLDTMSDAIGILYDTDATTDVLWCVAGNTDVVTVEKDIGSVYNPVAAVPTTLGVYLSLDRKSAIWYVDGVEVYRVDANSTALVGAVGLVPGVWNYEQATAYNCDVDYLYGAKGRSAA